ncbi:carbonic anhydrase 12-like isoform X2 [Acipenser ruthenus]|uniref:carbonic anhydrase 12-like isoform X2 n=1 Tax=Acipenser ruthenus TaxID=7906 RepID=UPI002742503B|nr:carbonic anhydrase 12-like isoform X2 [Acipenser ruthenus]
MTRRCLAVLLQCLHVIALTSAASDGSKWTYTGLEGKYNWPKKHPYCGGVSQSPIDIRNELLQYDPALQPVEVRGYNNCTEPLTLINNGHSVKMSLPSTMYISSLPHRYSAAQLHLHWGSTDHLGGSEHTINGKQYPAEMHIVHFNSDKYSNLSTAVDKADGLAVMGVFIDVGAFNPVFDHILSHLGSVRYRDQVVQIPAFNIFNLLPERLDEFYRYDGSLTTPPCYPSVLWTVFRNPVRISQEQLLSLQTVLYSTYVNEPISLKMNQNYRHPQETNERHVVVSFRDELTILHWNLGVILAITLAAVLGAVLIVALIVFMLIKKSKKNNQDNGKGVIYKPAASKEEDTSKV